MNPPVSVSVPLLLVTTTSDDPAAPPGVVQVMVLSLTVVMAVQGVPPIVTVFGPGLLAWKLAPRIVMAVPPPVEPGLGATEAITGTEL